MNLGKVVLKIDVAHEIGCRMDDTLDAATREVSQWEGAISALQQAGKDVEALTGHVNQDMDEGKMDQDTASHVKRYLIRATQILTNLGVKATQSRLQAQGKVAGITAVVAMVSKYKTEEETRLANMQKAVAEGTVQVEGGAQPGGHPGPTIKEQRLAQAPVAPTEQEILVAQAMVAVEEKAPFPDPYTAPPKKRKTRARNT